MGELDIKIGLGGDGGRFLVSSAAAFLAAAAAAAAAAREGKAALAMTAAC